MSELLLVALWGLTPVDVIRQEREDEAVLQAIAPGPPAGGVPADLGALDATTLDVPVRLDEDVALWVGLFTGPLAEPFARWLGRLDHHRADLDFLLGGEGLPLALGYLALVESGLMASATSTTGAAGPWQIARDTAPLLELRVDPWVDERRDLLLSTVGAAGLLRELKARFGDWSLAMVAYNTGPARLAAAIEAAGTAELEVLIREGHLDSEARHFVAKFHAAALIGENRERLGVQATAAPLPRTRLARAPGGASVDRLARCAEVSPEVFLWLNPVLGARGTPDEGRRVWVADPQAFRQCMEAS